MNDVVYIFRTQLLPTETPRCFVAAGDTPARVNYPSSDKSGFGVQVTYAMSDMLYAHCTSQDDIKHIFCILIMDK